MKPVSLKITGLHSFRETQTVDFTALSAAGLFGIFGPTGSGKSTVLDAVTLALFGKVERAARGTQGIINQSSDRVAVELVFELSQGRERRCFRVERVYKRSGDNTATLQAARLVELTHSGEVPLAEKKAVDGAVGELLGLNVDDFTRAVVLPQGKFDEFLKKVKPAERRSMLERLFDLEEFGDRLQKKVDREFETAGRTLAVCASELNGLGDASDEAMEKAGQAYREAVRLADECDARHQALEKRRGEMAQVWSMQEELAIVRLALAGLEQEGPAFERIRGKLAASQRAARVMPLVLAAEEAGAAHQEIRERLRGLQETLPGVLEQAARAEQSRTAAQNRRRQDEPRLLAQMGRLERALRLEEEVAALQEQQQARQVELNRLEERKKAALAEGENLERERASREGDLALCLEQLGRARVDQEWRQRVRQALTALEDWQRARRDFERASDDLAIRDNAAQSAQEALGAATVAEAGQNERLLQAGREEQSLRAGRPEDETSLEASAVEVERLRSRLAEVKELSVSLAQGAAALAAREEQRDAGAAKAESAADVLAQAQKKQEEGAARVKELEELLADLRVRNQAYVLAQTLRDDAPCPVCGSPYHPGPAMTLEAGRLDQVAGQLAAAQRQAAVLQKELDKARSGEAAARTAFDALKLAAGEAAATLSDLGERMNDRRSGLPAGWAGLSPAAMERELAGLADGLARRREALAGWRRDVEEARAVVEAARAAAGEAAVKKAGAASDREAKAAAAREAAGRVAAATAELAQRRIHLDAVRGDLAVESIRDEQTLIDERDLLRMELERQREDLEQRRRSVTAALEQQAGRVSGLMVEISTVAARLAQTGRESGEKQQEVALVTGGQPAGRLLEETKKVLAELAGMEVATGEAAGEVAARRETVEKDLAVAENSFHLAAGRSAKSLSELQAALDEEGFISGQEVREALLPAVEQEEEQKNLAAYEREWDRQSNRLRELRTKLAGRELAAAGWEACQDAVVQAAGARDRALEDKGARGKEYEKIQQNNIRWKELRGTADRAAARKGQLELLRGLFRGKAFVDFLAEEQLVSMASDASHRLGVLTNYRYALEVDSEGNFVIRDDANGGVRRPVSTLSGGETFVVSLALALALSLQIQMKGRYPLEFFFLDEGFGTLDPGLLETVVSTLERLRLEHLTIGIISHVPELRNRFPRQLVVCPAEASGAGSRLTLESN